MFHHEGLIYCKSTMTGLVPELRVCFAPDAAPESICSIFSGHYLEEAANDDGQPEPAA